MNQPRFTLWPWAAMALGVPAMAAAATLLGAAQAQEPQDLLTVFFGVLAAGNAYVFALAVGDFGRSVLAIPTGAVAGFLAVRIFAYPITNFLFLVFIALYALSALRAGGRGAAIGCGLLTFVFLGFLVLGSGVRSSGSDGSQVFMCLLSTYPFTCACVTATMPLEQTRAGVLAAAAAGLNAALYGLLMGSAAFVLSGVLWLVTLRPLSSQPWAAMPVVPALIALLVCNYFCAKHLFAGVHRVEAPGPSPAATEEAEEAPPPLLRAGGPASAPTVLPFSEGEETENAENSDRTKDLGPGGAQ